MGKYKYRELLMEEQHIEHEMKRIEREIKKKLGQGSLSLERNKKSYMFGTKNLCMKTNSGNLRHVVCSLYTERGLSRKEFANEIKVSESEIHDLIRKGMVTEKLLDLICTYFQIQKTHPAFIRYIQ
jgi:DNA-binding Xre family transcriptional regulator